MWNHDSSKSRFSHKHDQVYEERIHSMSKNSQYMADICNKLKSYELHDEAQKLEQCLHSYLSMQALVATSNNRSTSHHQEDTYQEEIIQSYKKQNEELQEKNNQLSVLVEELTTRISQIMSSQEKDRTDAHESLMDKSRPSVIIVKFRELYTDCYGEISAELQDMGSPDEEIAKYLLAILMKCMGLTKEYVEKAKRDTIAKVQQILEESPFAKQEKKGTLSKHLLDDVCKVLRESPDRNIIMKLQRGIFSHYCKSESFGPTYKKHLENYINECIEVTWLMNACNPAMYLHYDKGDDINYSPSRHSKFSGSGQMIDYFLWPCVYFSEDVFLKNGNVMAKSVVALKKYSKLKTKLTATDINTNANQRKDVFLKYGQGGTKPIVTNDIYKEGSANPYHQRARYNVDVASTKTSMTQGYSMFPAIRKQNTSISARTYNTNPPYQHSNATQMRKSPDRDNLISSYAVIGNSNVAGNSNLQDAEMFHHSENTSGRMGNSIMMETFGKPTACPIHSQHQQCFLQSSDCTCTD